MMFPKPLAETDPQSLEAQLVEAAREIVLDDADKHSLWARIAANLPPSPGMDAPAQPPPQAPSPEPAQPPPQAPSAPPRASPSPAASATAADGAGAGVAGTALGKGVFLMLGVTALGIAGYAAWPTRPKHAPRSEAPAVAMASAKLPPAVAMASDEPPPLALAPAEPPPRQMPATAGLSERSPSAPSAQDPHATSALREESLVLLEARAALRAGNPGSALELLNRARARFPRGALVQEREALTIEALSRSGQPQVAAQRAEAFLRQFPRSPHAADVRRYLAP